MTTHQPLALIEDRLPFEAIGAENSDTSSSSKMRTEPRRPIRQVPTPSTAMLASLTRSFSAFVRST